MKKIIIVLILCMSIFSIHGQINVCASIAKVTKNSTEFIYTTITNNSSEMLQIEDGGMFEPEFNSIGEYSSLTADFSGYSSNSMLICQRKSYPLSLPYGDQKLTIRIMPGKSYTTFTRLYTVGSQNGTFDFSYAPNIKYIDAKIHLICTLESMPTMKEIFITTNRITI